MDGTFNTFVHLIGSNITFTCEVNSTLTFNQSDFVWGCSTGCFADMVEEQTINITEIQESDSGVLNCSVVIDGMEYTSRPYDLQVAGMFATPYALKKMFSSANDKLLIGSKILV